MQIIKANGTAEPFNETKVLHSIQRAGVAQSYQQEVLQKVKNKLYDNIPTSSIYDTILESLDRSPQPYTKAKYSLKQAIMQLGPTGYPFEDFVARILQSRGYTVLVRQILLGKCVNHEIDVIATKDNKKIIVEAKFHNNPGTRSDVHVPLYVNSRFEDLKEQQHVDSAWIITNTKATSDAIAYAECVGMKIISWSYPQGESLRDFIEEKCLWPITMVTTLSLAQKTTLLQNHFVLCSDVLSQQNSLLSLHLSEDQKKKTLEELTFICQGEQQKKDKKKE